MGKSETQRETADNRDLTPGDPGPRGYKAADMFAAEGYCSDYGDPSPAAIRNFLLRKAREELRELKKPKKQKDPRTL